MSGKADRNIPIRKTILATALAWSLSIGFSAGSLAAAFSGVSSLQVQEASEGRVTLAFESDLPFQYELKILDPNRVALTLLNARLAETLRSAGQTINFSPTPGVQKAFLKNISNPDQVTLIFEGPRLGKKIIAVSGGTPSLGVESNALSSRPSQASKFLAQTNASNYTKPAKTPAANAAFVSTPGASAAATKTPVQNSREFLALLSGTAEPLDIPRLTPEKRPSSEPVVSTLPQGPVQTPVMVSKAETPPEPDDTALLSLVNRWASQGSLTDEERKAQPKTGKSGPMIESITDTAGSKYYNGATQDTVSRTFTRVTPLQAPPEPMASFSETSLTPAVSSMTSAPSLTPETVSTSHSTPEPIQPPATTPDIQTPEKPLPRYEGGAPPISYTVIGTDEAKNQTYTLPEAAVGPLSSSAHRGYNALSYAEETPYTYIDHFMENALKHYRRENYDQALAEINKAVILEDRNPAIQAALAEIYMKQNRYTDAVDAYEKALSLSSGNPADSALYRERSAFAIYQNPDKKAALEQLKNLLVKYPNPKQASVYLVLGTLYQENNDAAKALPYLKQAEKMAPDSADIQFNLALSYELTGQTTLAKTHYAQAQKLNPGASDIQEALNRLDATR